MCSIVGFEKRESDFLKVEMAFARTDSRGPDGTRFSYLKEGLIGFKRLAIMGLTEEGMQPFEAFENVVACNGEIYLFENIKSELSKEYIFKSDSDCEILLPLYELLGVSMFAKLDAEFALVLYDSKKDKLLAARDPLGIRPLYYGISVETGGYVFGSEPKIIKDFVKEIFPFPPGFYYDGEQFVRFANLTDVTPVHDDMDSILKNIKNLLIDGVSKRLNSDMPVGFLLSGGLDSSLVCAIAQTLVDKPIKTFAIGMESDAIDLKYAKQVADYLKTDHTEIIVDKDMVVGALEEVIEVLGTFDITTIRASIPMYLICKAISSTTDIRVLLTGEISDELFGYKYTDFAPTPQAFQLESKKRIDEIHMYDVLRADRSISANSLEARVPFGDLAFVKYVMEIKPEIKMNTYNKGKYLLRKAFEGDFLPHDILYREKAAFSDAVGHSMVDYLKEHAEVFYSDLEFKELCKKYTHATPFTKESLLYRELFEKYYKNQGHMIKDFWMPNKEWEGCNVDDPSARVLSNYGDSAK